MEYWSRLGTICYYDYVEYGPRLCEPTMLFMLGLESVLTPSSEYIRHVPVIDPETKEQEIDPETGEPIFEDKPDTERLKALILHRDQIGEDSFKRAYFYLYDVYPKEDVTEINVVFKNLKVSLNSITGTSSNRTMPILYHIYFNKPEITDFDAETEKLLTILDCAGYNKKDNSVPYIGKFGVTSESDLAAISEYNNSLKLEHERKKLHSQEYKDIDYKAMYIYALGVLYGCTCLGYDNNLIWRTDPSLWYDGEYSNLVKTAYEVFRFHYTHHLCNIDVDPHLERKYKGIQTNKIWNFNNEDLNIKQDEIPCKSLYINDDNEIVEQSIVYSKDSNSYLIPKENEWKPIDEFVLSNDPKIGIISNDSHIITRYIANNEVKLVSAYKYNKNKYLSPNDSDTYFCYTGNTGWVPFNENLWRSYSVDNQVLTLTPLKLTDIPSDAIQLARNKDDNSIIPYYQSYISDVNTILGVDRRSLFGILSKESIYSGIVNVNDDTEFEDVVSDEFFKEHYEFPFTPVGYSEAQLYDLDIPITVFVYDEDATMMWNGGINQTPIINYGYTLTPSEALEAFTNSDDESPNKYNLRYNSDDDYGYWSDSWEPKQWRKSFEDQNVFTLNGSVTLYKNSEVIIDEIKTYIQFVSDAEVAYIFNNKSIEDLSALSHGFIELSSLLDLGITTYPCEIVYTDKYGNFLLDEFNNPLVWYDSERELYWNGLYSFNVWQSEKPSLLTTLVINEDTNRAVGGFIEENELVPLQQYVVNDAMPFSISLNIVTLYDTVSELIPLKTISLHNYNEVNVVSINTITINEPNPIIIDGE